MGFDQYSIHKLCLFLWFAVGLRFLFSRFLSWGWCLALAGGLLQVLGGVVILLLTEVGIFLGPISFPITFMLFSCAFAVVEQPSGLLMSVLAFLGNCGTAIFAISGFVVAARGVLRLGTFDHAYAASTCRLLPGSLRDDLSGEFTTLFVEADREFPRVLVADGREVDGPQRRAFLWRESVKIWITVPFYWGWQKALAFVQSTLKIG